MAQLEKQREENKKDRLAEQKGLDGQIEAVRKKYYGTDKWMKAPNGNDTNLTERQWLQVRTANFKKWFGDWEKKSRIEKLLNSETLVLKWDDKTPAYNLDPASAEKFLPNEYQGRTFRNEDTGEDYILSKTGRHKLVSHNRYNEAHLKSLFFLPEIVKTSIFITEENARKDTSKYVSYRYFVSGINLDGVDYTVKSVFGLDSNGAWVYDQELSEIEKGALIGMRTKHVTQDSLQVKDTTLLSILQDDYSKVLDENGEPLVVYHGARTDQKFTVFENKANFFTDNRKVAEMFAAEYAYRLIVDGEEYALDNMSAQSIAEAIEPLDIGYIMKAFDIGIDNILDDWVTTEQLDDLVDIGGIQIGIDSFNGAEEISILPPSNKIFEVFLDIKNPQNVDFEGRFWEVGDDEKLTPKVGYDGVIARNIIEGGFVTELEIPSTDYVVSNANQIKSATDNNGDFSLDNPDIRYQDSLNTQPRVGTGSNSNLIASSYRFDTDKGKYYITDGVQKEVFQVVSATMPNGTEEQLSDLRKTTVFATSIPLIVHL